MLFIHTHLLGNKSWNIPDPTRLSPCLALLCLYFMQRCIYWIFCFSWWPHIVCKGSCWFSWWRKTPGFLLWSLRGPSAPEGRLPQRVCYTVLFCWDWCVKCHCITVHVERESKVQECVSEKPKFGYEENKLPIVQVRKSANPFLQCQCQLFTWLFLGIVFVSQMY